MSARHWLDGPDGGGVVIVRCSDGGPPFSVDEPIVCPTCGQVVWVIRETIIETEPIEYWPDLAPLLLLFVMGCAVAGCSATYPSGMVLEKNYEASRVGYGQHITFIPEAYTILVRSEDGDVFGTTVDAQFYASVQVGAKVPLACNGWLGCEIVR